MKDATEVFEEALDLSGQERALLVEELLKSLRQPDEQIDQKWKTEVKNRLEAADKGEMDAKPLGEVISKYRD